MNKESVCLFLRLGGGGQTPKGLTVCAETETDRQTDRQRQTGREANLKEERPKGKEVASEMREVQPGFDEKHQLYVLSAMNVLTSVLFSILLTERVLNRAMEISLI